MMNTVKISKTLFIILITACVLISSKVARASTEKICLSGDWDFVVGKSSQVPETSWGKIRIPHYITGGDEFATDISSVQSISTRFWFKTDIFVPKRFEGNRIKLNIESFSFYLEVYVNNKLCATMNSNELREDSAIDITDAVRFGANNKIYLFNQDSSIIAKDREKKENEPSFEGKGIDGNVFLEKRPLIYVKDTFIMTSVRERKLTVKTWVKNEDKIEHEISVSHQAQHNGNVEIKTMEKTVSIKPGETKVVEISKLWGDPALWGIGGKYGEPSNLYFLKTVLKEKNKEVDVNFKRFGFREFYIEGNDFYLNCKKIYLQGDNAFGGHGFLQYKWNPFFPERYYRILQEANFNFLRWLGYGGTHIFEVADEMGIMVEPTLGTDYKRLASGDEAFRKEAEKSIEMQIKKVWSYPSVIIYSPDNESAMLMSGPPAEKNADEIAKINVYMRTIDPTRSLDNHGDDMLRYDNRVEILNSHYRSLDEIKFWEYKYKKPLILGEMTNLKPYMLFYSTKEEDKPKMADGLIEQDNWLKEQIPLFVKWNVSGIMPYGLAWFGFNGDNPMKAIGPWGDLGAHGTFRFGKYVWIDVPWPALSGPFVKVGKMRTGFRDGFINWFDSSRPEFVTSRCYETLKKVFRPMPRAKEVRLSPQIILKVVKAKEKIPYACVYVKPLENQGLESMGVRADSEGRAWFILPENGRYSVEVENYDIVKNKEIKVDYRKPNPKPGFDIPILDIEVKEKK